MDARPQATGPRAASTGARRRARSRLATLALAACLVTTVPSRAGAQGAAPRTASLSWVRPADADACFPTRALARAVDERLGRRVIVSASDADLSVEASVHPTSEPIGWRAVVTLRDAVGRSLGTREITSDGPSCDSLRAPLAVVIAVLVDPEASLSARTTRPLPRAAPAATPPAAAPCAPPGSPTSDPYPGGAAEHPAKCAGTNYYSGAWMKANGYYAPGKGLMMFHARMPAPVQGMFPALWARNEHGDQYYGEADLIETWWDIGGKNNPTNNSRLFSSTTHMVTDAWYHTNGNSSPLIENLTTAFHVWEVEWDAAASPAAIRYYYRDAPGAARVLLRTVTYQSAGLSGNVSAAQFKTIVSDGWRPYIDFAVQPDSVWHVGPDAAATYDPEDVQVESVVVCKP